MFLYVGGHFKNTKNNAVSIGNSNLNILMMASVTCAVLLMHWEYKRFAYMTPYGATPAKMC